MKTFTFICFLAGVITLTCAVDRPAILRAAVQEVKDYMNQISEMAESEAYKSSGLIKSMKPYTASSQAIGKARIQFEKMVKAAERRLIQQEREEQIAMSDKKVLAESYANEAFHKPGTILTSEEIAYLSVASDCAASSTEEPDCDTISRMRWRTASGVCNNRNNSLHGSANTPMRRLIGAQYEDGISTPRGALQMSGNLLVPPPFSPPFASARTVSNTIVRDEEVNDTAHTLLLMQWGQFMDHDLDAMPEFEHCPTDNCDITEECAPFLVSDVDQNVVRQNGGRCHPFRRSLGVCARSDDTELTAREHMNSISHFIDASTIYSSEQTIQDSVLRMTGAITLTTEDRPTGELLPYANLSANPHYVICPAEPCYLAGDARVNEQPGLISMHTLWVREHNRIAQKLSDESNFMDFRIFHLARAIVIAEIQKITYSDYLPKLLGTNSMLTDYNYNSAINPSIPNAFATAAFRFGHSQVQPFIELVNNQSGTDAILSLNEVFFNPVLIENNGIEPFIRGMLKNPPRALDEFINSILTSRLFSSDSNVIGEDLASRNIQRGRGHGLAPYGDWERWANTNCFVESEFRSQMTVARMVETYGSIEDVDLFVGGLAEEPLPGGIIGPTFGCIIAVTFKAVRDGDRFFYKHERPSGNVDTIDSRLFTSEQINEIDKTSLSSVICNNVDSDNFGQIQPDAFLLPDMNSNIKVDCSQIPSMDLTVFSQGNREEEEENENAEGADEDKELFVMLQDIVNRLEKKGMAQNVNPVESNMNREEGKSWSKSWSKSKKHSKKSTIMMPSTMQATTEPDTTTPDTMSTMQATTLPDTMTPDTMATDTVVPATVESGEVSEEKMKKMSAILSELLERMTRK